MATGKKSFILYADISDMVSELPDDQAGKLFKIILDYVNDKNPEPTDLLLKIAFNPIKQQLKRDLKKYEQYIEKQRDNGKKGGRPSVKTETQKTQAFNLEPKKADSDNVNDNDSDNVNNVVDTTTADFAFNNLDQKGKQIFEMFGRVLEKGKFTDTQIISEVGKFQNKYPEILLNKSGPLINSWASRMTTEVVKDKNNLRISDFV